MFTGIITDIGTVDALEERGDLQARIRTGYDTDGIDIGASIACDGVCLTVTGLGAMNGASLTVNDVEGARFGVNIIAHTKAVTTWGAARVGDAVNLEIDMMARYVARLRAHEAA